MKNIAKNSIVYGVGMYFSLRKLALVGNQAEALVSYRAAIPGFTVRGFQLLYVEHR